MATARIAPNPPQEELSSEPVREYITRKTKGGRTLKYRLTILQQPERARACGSGSKAATDRRPVDPPPVVELNIYEVDGDKEKDITFMYRSNFILYVTLEVARKMAHGRVQTPAATSPPVLTGMPVSGMALLDRPDVAAYFLFPDLSVRHEGFYRLVFNLYEEVKVHADLDEDDDDDNLDYFIHRIEIKSTAFQVYSAKKFPGLASSTTLSRCIAEQGCRVRVRRDIRMRKREERVKVDPDFNADGGYGRPPRTPDRQMAEQYRQRSLSAASDVPHGPEPPRRQSAADTQPLLPSGFPNRAPHLGFNQPTRRVSHRDFPPLSPKGDLYEGTRPSASPRTVPQPVPQPAAEARIRRASGQITDSPNVTLPEMSNHNAQVAKTSLSVTLPTLKNLLNSALIEPDNNPNPAPHRLDAPVNENGKRSRTVDYQGDPLYQPPSQRPYMGSINVRAQTPETLLAPLPSEKGVGARPLRPQQEGGWYPRNTGAKTWVKFNDFKNE